MVLVYEFEMEFHDTKVGVNLKTKLCDCGYLQLKGVPCVYALACLNFIIDANKELYTDLYFQTTAWKMCYSSIIHPISNQDLWPRFKKNQTLKPPKVKRLQGRPKKGRRKDPYVKLVPIKRLMKPKWKCPKYNQLGHKTRSCTNELVLKKPKGKPRRPKKNKEGLKTNNKATTNGTAGILEVKLKSHYKCSFANIQPNDWCMKIHFYS